jgi:hypothetical protein
MTTLAPDPQVSIRRGTRAVSPAIVPLLRRARLELLAALPAGGCAQAGSPLGRRARPSNLPAPAGRPRHPR